MGMGRLMSERVPKKVMLPPLPPPGVLERAEAAWDRAYKNAGPVDLMMTVYNTIFDALPAVIDPPASRKPRVPKMAWGDLYWQEPEPTPRLFWLGRDGEI